MKCCGIVVLLLIGGFIGSEYGAVPVIIFLMIPTGIGIAWSIIKNKVPREFTDPRDSQMYRVVKIGKQVWMAENLNYKPMSGACFGNDDYRAKYGLLYDWETAMAVCPPGWHIPSYEEWEVLEKTASSGSELSVESLRSDIGWRDDANGTDAYGFSALPGGGYGFAPSLSGTEGNWWASTRCDIEGKKYAYFIRLCTEEPGRGFRLRDCETNRGLSVRCIRDNRG